MNRDSKEPVNIICFTIAAIIEIGFVAIVTLFIFSRFIGAILS